jgi:hypothetical protein
VFPVASFLMTVELDKLGDFTMPVPKAKLAFHGRDRKRIKKLQTYLKQIQDMDVRNAARATALGVPAVSFATNGATNVTGSISAVLTRCESALTQKVSAQVVGGGGGGGG